MDVTRLEKAVKIKCVISPASRRSTPSSRSRTPTLSKRFASSVGGSSPRRANTFRATSSSTAKSTRSFRSGRNLSAQRQAVSKPAQMDETGAESLALASVSRRCDFEARVSQGICFPLSDSPGRGPDGRRNGRATDLLGVLKWEPPLPVGMSGKVKGPFPGFLPKTDETRIQVLEGVLSRHRGKTFSMTEKLDGTSFTAFLREGKFGICSRNLWMDETDESNIHARVAKAIRVEEKLRAARDRLGFDVALQAEVIGPGIQKNKYALPAATLRVFSVLNVDRYRLLDGPDASGAGSTYGTGIRASAWHAGPGPFGGRACCSIGRPERSQPEDSAGRGSFSGRLPRNVTREIGGRSSFKVINPEVFAEVRRVGLRERFLTPFPCSIQRSVSASASTLIHDCLRNALELSSRLARRDRAHGAGRSG